MKANRWGRPIGGRNKREADEAAPIVLSEDDEGSVLIAPAVLETFVRREVDAVGGAEKCDVTLTGANGAVDVTLRVSLRQGTKISEFSRTARRNVRRALADMVGVEVGKVVALVAEITPAAQDEPGRRKS